jgi:hypothetical protein
VLHPERFDYELMRTTLDELEDRYSYNKQAAQDAIAQEMEARGAVMGDDGC